MTQKDKQEYISDYRFGWRTQRIGIPYGAMRSEGEKDGWIARFDESRNSAVLTAGFDVAAWQALVAEVANA